MSDEINKSVPSGGERKCPHCELKLRIMQQVPLIYICCACQKAFDEELRVWRLPVEPVSAEATKPPMSGVLCAKWKVLDDGCVARCDQPHNHPGKHLDSVIAIGWTESVEKEDALVLLLSQLREGQKLHNPSDMYQLTTEWMDLLLDAIDENELLQAYKRSRIFAAKQVGIVAELQAEISRLTQLLQKIMDTVNLLPSVTHSPITQAKDIVYAIRDLQECYRDAARARNGLITGAEFVQMRKAKEELEAANASLKQELKDLREDTKASEVERSRNADKLSREGY